MTKLLLENLAESVGLTYTALMGRHRSSANVSRRRQMVMYLMVKEMGMGSVEVSKLLSRDNTTVRYGVNVIKEQAKTNLELSDFLHKTGQAMRAAWPEHTDRVSRDPVAHFVSARAVPTKTAVARTSP